MPPLCVNVALCSGTRLCFICTGGRTVPKTHMSVVSVDMLLQTGMNSPVTSTSIPRKTMLKMIEQLVSNAARFRNLNVAV